MGERACSRKRWVSSTFGADTPHSRASPLPQVFLVIQRIVTVPSSVAYIQRNNECRPLIPSLIAARLR
ncbi:hypothetical protein SAMN04490179_3314 [Pseudomonas antarctica]|uniref:Uncharacterized protein n=1 Tax=Pseudomonas antarctica TaxID=219572 RepID=A0A1G9ZUN6_9PSED|nr:hypothetical protein PSAN_38740 [Pseudomonas antarctica]SDN24884.1 hypothetical protein SAMN04490179_3314 [Pseudomonas antarctica]